MQKQIFVFTSLFFCVNLLTAQVNFQEEFSFDKLMQEDVLWDIQLFDYDDNGIEEIAVSYYHHQPNADDWKLVIYDQAGDTLKTITLTVPDDYFNRFHCFRADSNNYFLRANLKDNGTLMRIYIQDCETLQIVDSLIISRNRTDVFWEIHRIDQLEIDSIPVFLIGVDQGSFGLEGVSKSFIHSIKLENNELLYLNELENCGLSMCIDPSVNFLSTGLYSFGAIPITSNTYYLNSITKELPFEKQQLFNISGNQSWDVPSLFYHFPYYFCTLTNNNQSDNPHVLYYQIYDTAEGDSVFFRGFDVTNGYEVWSVENSLSEMQEITASTCVPVNDDDHYFMYFYDSELKIRDRLNGNIIHHQDSVLAVCDILRKIDGELLFFVEKDDETGYEVYTLDGPIFVSADEPHNQNDIIIEQYPNPFHFSTTFSFFSKEPFQNVELRIYNIKGQLVRELKIQNLKWKINEAVWDGRDEKGNETAQGIYFYKCYIDDKNIIGKMIKIQ